VQSKGLQKKFSGQFVEFYYGVLEEDVMTFAIKSDLENVYAKSPVVSDDAEVKKALAYLNGADVGITYFSPNAFFHYMDRLLQFAQEEGMPASELGEYERMKNYFMPIRSIVGASVISGDTMNAQLFVHIAR
jgi:hypothetical protein